MPHTLPDLTSSITHVSEYPVASGGFSDIYQGQLASGKMVAIKVVRVNATDKVQNCWRRETRFWNIVDHAHVVKCLGTCTMGFRMGLVTPWLSNGNACEYVNKEPNADRIRIIIQAGLGLRYLHEQGIAHGDVKGANILIDDLGNAQLTDFGLARMIHKMAEFTRTSTSLQNAGSSRFMAPELILFEVEREREDKNQKGVDYIKADIYAYGCTILEILTGQRPFSEIPRDIAVMHRVASGCRPARPPELDDYIWTLCVNCWQHNPADRPTIQNALIDLLLYQNYTLQREVYAADLNLLVQNERIESLETSLQDRQRAKSSSRRQSDASILSIGWYTGKDFR